MANRIQHRRDTAANWTAANPVLAAGEPALETDTLKTKLGDGTTVWTSLGYRIDKGSADATYERVFPVAVTPNGTTDNTAAFQAALNASNAAGGGIVRVLPATSAYVLQSALTVYSNTYIDARGATINLKGYAGRVLRNNSESAAAVRTVTDGAITTGTTTLTSATAAFTSADLNRSVSIAGAGGAAQTHNTVITAVTNGTTVTIRDAAGTTVSAASTSLYNRDSNITVIGGSWTRDATASNDHMFVLHRIDGVEVRDNSFASTNGKYAVLFADVTRFKAANISCSTFADGVHTQGPAFGGLIEGIYGTTGDDMVPLTARDYSAYELSTGGGNISAVTIRNIRGTNVKQGVKVLAGAGVKVRDVLVEDVNCSTYSGNVVVVSDDTANANTTGEDVDAVTIRGVTGTPASGYNLVALGGTGIGRITVDDVRVKSTLAATMGVLIGSSFNGDSVLVSNINMSTSLNHAGVQVTAGAVINLLSINGVRATLDPGKGNGRVLNLGASPVRTKLSNVSILNGQNLINSTTTATAYIEMSNVSAKGMINVIAISAAAHNIDASNIVGDSLTNGFFVLTGGSLDLQINTWRPVGTAALLFRSASQTARVNGSTAKCDLTALTPSDGDLIYNTNATPACGVGLLVYNTAAAKWKNIYTGVTN